MSKPCPKERNKSSQHEAHVRQRSNYCVDQVAHMYKIIAPQRLLFRPCYQLIYFRLSDI